MRLTVDLAVTGLGGLPNGGEGIAITRSDHFRTRVRRNFAVLQGIRAVAATAQTGVASGRAGVWPQNIAC
ncbi:MAG: hypothetical protein IPK85_00815 [Gemmatimonadetes bacterium]|nr:hypothetical protein [Gemmatimonadota bacterium]